MKIERCIGVWNSILSTQYRYKNKDTIKKIERIINYVSNDVDKAESIVFESVRQAAQYYQRYQRDVFVPPLQKVLDDIAKDFISQYKRYEVDKEIKYSDLDVAPGKYHKSDYPEPEQPAQSIPQLTPEQIADKERKEQKKMAEEKGLKLLAEVMANTIKDINMSDIEDGISQNLESKIDKYIADKYGPITRKTTLILDGKAKEIQGVVHEKFGEVLNYVANNEPVFLTGAAGTGKNYLCKQIADALGIPFHFTNAVTQEYKLTGFTDANGTFHETEFYKAFKNGGLFMLDEMDASIPEVLIILNAAIANRYFDFPAPIGYVEAHPNFRVVAAGNTYGNGADYDYVGRSQLDAASLDRFGLVSIDYDPRIEEAMAQGDSELLGFCRAFRKACKEAGIRTVVSYRAINRMAKLKAALPIEELLKSALIKGLTAQDLKTIKDKLQSFGDYTMALNKLAQ